MIECKLCGNLLDRVVGSHLQNKHNGMLSSEYEEQFPGSPTVDPDIEASRIATLREVTIGHIVTEETRELISYLLTGRKLEDSHKTNLSIAEKAYWSSKEGVLRKDRMMQERKEPEYRKRLIYNKGEQSLDELLQKLCPGEWKYFGETGSPIGEKFPDFLNINGKKKIIEYFGNFWHKLYEEKIRKDYFREFGYDTLIIWSSQLKEIDKSPQKLYELVKRIKEFTYND